MINWINVGYVVLYLLVGLLVLLIVYWCILSLRQHVKNYRPPTAEERLQSKLDLILLALFTDDD